MDLSQCPLLYEWVGPLSAIYLLGVAIYYAWAEISQNRETQIRVKREMAELFFTLFWVGSMMLIFQFISTALFGGSDPFQAVLTGLSDEVQRTAVIYSTMRESTLVRSLFILQRLRLIFGAAFVSPYQTFYYLLEKVRVTLLVLYQYLNLMATVYMAFDYLSRMSCLLPLGVVLRLIPPFKKLGNLFLALFVSIYYVFPYVFHLIYVSSLPNVDMSFLDEDLFHMDCINLNSPFPSAVSNDVEISIVQGKLQQVINSFSKAMTFIYLVLFPTLLITYFFFRYFLNLLGTPHYLFNTLMRRII